MFASKSPRDLNHDPRPYYDIETRLRYADAPAGTDYYLRHEPRPEFDPPKAHNEPNPILVAHRSGTMTAALYLAFIDAILGGAKPDAETEHARKVLSRLSRLEQK